MVGEGLVQPDLGLLQQEMEEAPARVKSKEVRAKNCHPWCDAERPGPDQLEEQERGRGMSVQGIYDQRH